MRDRGAPNCSLWSAPPPCLLVVLFYARVFLSFFLSFPSAVRLGGSSSFLVRAFVRFPETSTLFPVRPPHPFVPLSFNPPSPLHHHAGQVQGHVQEVEGPPKQGVRRELVRLCHGQGVQWRQVHREHQVQGREGRCRRRRRRVQAQLWL